MTASAVLTGEHFMQGDHACAEGALAAGCRFFGGYPITPSTEVAERLAQRLPELQGVFIQMEDELGSIAAVLGASAAGKRAMTATSGPGFSLMMENIGLAVMMELPCVVVDVQRGSPSTGLPTLPCCPTKAPSKNTISTFVRTASTGRGSISPGLLYPLTLRL